MVDCNKFKEDFSSFLDGELPHNQQQLLEDHLNICLNCKETIRQIKIIKHSLSYLPQVSTSPDFEQKLHHQIFQRNQKAPFLPEQLQNWKLPAMGSAIVLATLGLFLVFNQSPDSAIPSQNSADNPYNTAAPQLPGSRQTPVGTSSTSQTAEYESSTLIADSAGYDSLYIQKEGIQQVKGQ
jgi:predicted anti-sigma-YlaC factor YlaD